jgi:Co/Zn/Cd efflux system component
MSGHIILGDDGAVKAQDVLAQINHLLEHDYGITHTTIQIENEHCGRDDEVWLANK